MITKKINRAIMLIGTLVCCTYTYAQSLKEKAEAGDMEAQYKYAISLSSDIQQPSSEDVVGKLREKEAFNWTLKAAEQGHANAQNLVGYRYFYGIGVTQDYTKAFYWYSKSAEQGNKSAIYNKGLCYKYGHGIAKSSSHAFDCFKKSADYDYEPAKCKLAECYRQGEGAVRDDAKAFKLYSELADNSNTEAQYELALMYLQGAGVEKDSIAASNLLLASAGGGTTNPHQVFGYNEKDSNSKARKKLVALASITDSQYYYYISAVLGCLYEAEADFIKAEDAYKKSIDAGGKLGVIKLGLMYFYNVANDSTQNYYMDDYTESNGLGLECWKYSPKEENALKKYLSNKIWTQKDNAVYWLEKATEYGAGNFEYGAMPYTIYTHLLFCYNDGIGGFLNTDKAIDVAYRYLSDEEVGDWHDYEFSVAVLSANSEKEAYSNKIFNIYSHLYDLVRKPSAKYSSAVLRIATAGLGKAYYKGLGTTKDYANAFKYLSIAADLNDSESMRLLAACYRYGRGTQRNSIKEKEWMDKAIKMRDDKAVELYNRLTGKSS